MKCRMLFLVAPAVVLGLSCDGAGPSKTLEPAQLKFANASGVGAHGDGAPSSVVFHSARSGSSRIYTMNPDGSSQHLVTTGGGTHTWPDISPNGRYLAYTSNATGNNEIMVMDLASGASMNITNNSAEDNWARWSPNGKLLAFHSNRDGNYNIFTMSPDGTGLQRITSNTLLDQWPDWSPDGKRLAFRRGQNVFVADAGGEEEGVEQLTFSSAPTINQMAVWSPSGKELAFMSTRAGYPSVWLMTGEGESSSPAVNLTPKNQADAASLWLSRAPAWSANGRQIYFMSFRPSTNGDVELFVMQRDGSDLRRITYSTGDDGGPQTR